jgi:hypothetical protein
MHCRKRRCAQCDHGACPSVKRLRKYSVERIARLHAMQHVPPTVLLAVAITVYLTLDTALILQTGKTPGLFYKYLRYRQRSGPITRKGRPQRFWAYVIGNVTVLALCIGYLAWVLFSKT